MSKISSALLASALFAAAISIAAPAKAQSVAVEEPWARATIGQSKNSAVYMRLVNRGGEMDRLVAASSPAAAATELHATIRDGEVMKMRAVQAIDLKPGEAVVFEPGGLHVMFLGVKQPLHTGDHVPLVLQFEKAGKIEVQAVVRTAGNQSGH